MTSRPQLSLNRYCLATPSLSATLALNAPRCAVHVYCDQLKWLAVCIPARTSFKYISFFTPRFFSSSLPSSHRALLFHPALLSCQIKQREKALFGVFQQIAVHFADLHDTPGRMKAKGADSACSCLLHAIVNISSLLTSTPSTSSSPLMPLLFLFSPTVPCYHYLHPSAFICLTPPPPSIRLSPSLSQVLSAARCSGQRAELSSSGG